MTGDDSRFRIGRLADFDDAGGIASSRSVVEQSRQRTSAKDVWLFSGWLQSQRLRARIAGTRSLPRAGTKLSLDEIFEDEYD
jgi:hypothetical protein